MTAQAMQKWTDAEVYYQLSEAQEKEEPPITVRLIRLKAMKKKNDVWRVSNVLDVERMSVQAVRRFFRMRWENE